MSAEGIVIDMRRAVRTQQWEEALVLAGIGRAADGLTDAWRIEILAGEAQAYRRTGQLPEARERYLELDALLDRDDPRRAEVLIGLAECYMAVGLMPVAGELAGAALERAQAGSGRWARAGRVAVLAQAQEDLAAGEALAAALLAEAPQVAHRAPLLLARAEVLLRAGRLDEAAQALLVARSEGEAATAARTLAEIARRETALLIARGDAAQYYPRLGQLQSLEKAYAQTGERGEHELMIMRAALLLHLGKISAAVTDLRRAYWLAHERHDAIAAAHALLALADAQRVGGGDGEEAREHAGKIYARVEHPWGQLWSAVMIDDPLHRMEEVARLRGVYPRALGAGELRMDVSHLPERPLPLTFP